MTDNMPKAYESEAIEKKWYSFWWRGGHFRGVIDPGKSPYSIAIPPPNVTGILTLGHVLNNTLQDILIRRRKMQGYSTCWFPGTDHAGIATESKVDRYLRETEGKGRHDMGREEFIGRVWKWKEQYGGTIIRQLRELGCACDWERERFTMDEGLSRAVQEVFVRLYERGHIYRGRRMINWCPVSRTALSDEEVIYKEVDGHFYHFKYPLSDSDEYLEIATTRPETMLGDTAVAVHPNDPRYQHMIGKTIDLPLTDRKIPIVADIHADPEFGTGCVKITPAHDPNDFIVGQRHNLPVINVMNPDATMNENAGEEFVGLDRFECREKVVFMMKDFDLLVKIEDHRHNVGYSERGDVPIEPMVSEQWFVDMKKLAKPALDAVLNGDIKFHPDRWTKVYAHWMENIQDWCVSRQIWWGHRIPAWYNDKTGAVHVGLEAPKTEGPWRQEEDVLDTWFSSWLWPFSIQGWPDKTPEQDYFFPTSDLVTGPDIIFFWVARMIMASLEFKGQVPFRNVYFTSIIRDDKGRKLSKSLGNSPDPLEVIKKYGADALRFSIIYIAPVGMDIRYNNEKCEIGRNFANKLWNACRFRQMQGEVTEGYLDLKGVDVANLTPDERWVIAWLNDTIVNVNNALDRFSFHQAAHDLYEFVWGVFCDWYIEAAKSRLMMGGDAKKQALTVLDFALYKILRALHPFMPFITEELALQMGFLKEGETIMNAPYPMAPYAKIPSIMADDTVTEMVESKFEIIRAGRNLRATYDVGADKKPRFVFKTDDATLAAFLKTEEESICRMMGAAVFETVEDFAPDGPAPSMVTNRGALYLPLKGVIDVDAERAKLDKQMAELRDWLNKSQAKLSNEKFLNNAPADIVEQTREKHREIADKLARVKETLDALSA